MERPQVFLSFSSGDTAGVRRLLARLSAQPLEIWDYSSEGQEIPLGLDIGDYLEDKIARCNVFIPVLSTNCFASSYTAREVACALECHRKNRLVILPLLLPDGSQDFREWPTPFDKLAGMRFYKVDILSRQELEDVLIFICERLGISYRPLLMGDEKLPFMESLVAEMKNKCPQKAERDIGVYRRVMQILQDFQAFYETVDYTRALEKATFLVLTLEQEFAENSFYYPYIVQAVCLISCGHLTQAAETLNKIWESPMLDENAFAAMGYIRYQQGEFQEALEFYLKAREYDQQDPAARSWVAKTSLLLGIPVDVESLFDAETTAKISDEQDKKDFCVLKAQALANMNRFAEAEQIYAELLQHGVQEAGVIINYAYVLIESGKQQQALAELEKYRLTVEKNNPDYFHLLACLYFLLQKPKKAAKRFQTLIRQWPDNRRYRLDAAQVFCRLGDCDQARDVLAPLIRDPSFPLPATEHDFYCDGFANWVHGEFALAEYDFRRSRAPSENFYDAILNKGAITFTVMK